ncbi:MAG: hypothetical protein KDE27_31295, partial [Planctomycetes bacterium]|nr:hypothetical protein [Planctomycetota bacterium]
AASLPPGLAFAAAIAMFAGRGFAATRRAVLARAGVAVVSTSVWSLAGVLTMKKVVVVLGVALALLASLPFWWSRDEALAGPGAANDRADSSSIAIGQGDIDAEAPAAPPERTAAAATKAPADAVVAAETVVVDLLVRAVWRESRRPAVRVPLTLVTPPGDRLANAWSDAAGEARFACEVPSFHWPIDLRVRTVAVTTPLMPGRYFNLELGADAATLEVELDDGQHVVGVVVDPAGNRVAGADIRMVHRFYPETVVASSDGGGAFEIAGLPVGFELRASAGAAESAPATIADLADGALVLRLDQAGGLVRIHVVDASGSTGKPVADATVELDSGEQRQPPRRRLLGVTDAAGSATFACVPGGAYVVRVVHRANLPMQQALSVAAGGPWDTTVVLGEAATLVGIVRRSGQPAGGVRVSVNGADSLFHRDGFRTDTDGRFGIERLAVGRHLVLFHAAATAVARYVDLHAGEQTVEFELPGGAEIAGRLRLPDGSPARRWRVAARRTDEMAADAEAKTDDAGRFEIPDLPDESFRLDVTGPDGGGHTFFGVRTDGSEADYRLPTEALWQPASIVGRFADVPAGATLWKSDRDGGGGSGRGLGGDGVIAFDALAPGSYRIWLERDDSRGRTALLWLTEVTLASGERKDLGVVVPPRPGSIAVALRPAAGVDPQGAFAMLRSTVTGGGGRFGPMLELGADGAWHGEGVPSGSWWVVAGGDGIAPAVREVFVAAGGSQRLEIQLEPAVAVDLRLHAGDTDALTVGWRREVVRRADDRAIFAFREIVGSLHTRLDLAPGSYTIEIDTGGGYHGIAAFTVPAEEPVEVPLSRRW